MLRRMAPLGLAFVCFACGGSTSPGSGTDGGAADAEGDATVTDASIDVHDDVNRVCAPGTCIVGAGGSCQPPTGPTGNGCCKCTGDYCTAQCKCAAFDTPIATPSGYRPIDSLQVGDLVYSEHRGALRAVPVRETSRVRVEQHEVVRVRLANGTTLRISPRHPTADGRAFADLRKGELLDQLEVVDVEVIAYDHSYTHDILPDSDTGTYVAGGALIGSTLSGDQGAARASRSTTMSSPAPSSSRPLSPTLQSR
jgi:hypothetical protein